MIRELLQNRVYTGRVRHTDTIYKGSLGQVTMSRRGRGEWFEGKHEGFVSDDLFEQVQQVRTNAAHYAKKSSQMKTYILHDQIFCARCIARKPRGLAHDNFGRMRPIGNKTQEVAYYRCLARDHGYEKCDKGTCTTLIADCRHPDEPSHPGRLQSANLPEPVP
ncbi:MAG: recombinase family protein [Chloroflexi bacterium]|nr:recombinase family protein [Chloroflexota bacterium]